MSKETVDNFGDAIKMLGIEEYSDRIINSNSRGELFHVLDYVDLANALYEESLPNFKPWFDGVVKFAEDNWERPESIFQHVKRVFLETHE